MFIKAISQLFLLTTLKVTLAANLTPDLSLLRQWNANVYNTHQLQPFPKVVKYQADGKTLVYVATKHKNWKDSQQLIQQVIEQVRPNAIMIEGLHSSWGESPQNWKHQINRNLNAEGLEDYFAYKLALSKNIRMFGSEPGKMSDFSSYQRDQFAVKKIAELINRFNKLLVIYGAGHFVQQEKVLEKMLGKPTAN